MREFYSLYTISLTIIFLRLISEIYSRLIQKIEDEETEEFTLGAFIIGSLFYINNTFFSNIEDITLNSLGN